MTGRIRPKSMSTEEAADWIANPQEQALDNLSSGDMTPLDELRETLAQAVVEEDKPARERDPATGRYLPVEPSERELAFSPGEQQLYTPNMDAEGTYLPVRDEPEQALRAWDAIEQDTWMLTSHEALCYPAEARHGATLRLIDDLVAARGVLEDISTAVAAAQR